MTKHARFAPSAAERWLACPASIRLIEQYGLVSETSAAAELGTHAHDIVKQCLLKGLDVRDVLAVPAPELLLLQTYLDEVRAVLLEHAHERPELIVEQTVHVDAECWGTLDAGIITPSGVYIFDYKNGRHPVPATGNPQLLTYALALSHVTSRPSYELVIVQPRASTGFPVKRWIAHRRDVRQHGARIKAARRLVARADPVPGNHCHYCPARKAGVCPVAQND